MPLSHISRNVAKTIFAFVTLGFAAACSDSTSAPTSQALFKAPAQFDIVLGVKIFRVGREGTVQRLGEEILHIPADAVCDPLLSSYGPSEWDKPCTPMLGSVLVTATMLEDRNGHPYIDFQPALRFVPTKEVNLYMRSGKGEKATTLTVNYCTNLGYCYDESKTDPSLKTQRIGRSAILVRRIKHFSGYSLAAGEECPGTITEEADGTLMCHTEGEGGVARRSGYILASGLADDDTVSADSTSRSKKYEQ